jgi:hypothetical protein
MQSPLLGTLNGEVDARLLQRQAEGAPQAELDALLAERTKANKMISVRVMRDLSPLRETRQLLLGRYDAPVGDPLDCAAPAVLPPFPEDAPRNRLGLAQWVVMPENPLTARVTVNRFWLRHFGRALVPAVDNFGTQTAAPAHLPLLDWLAQTFVDSGWNVKAFHKLLVLSSTYRQSSSIDPESGALDLDNAAFGRGPLHRLPAEVVRDLPLSVSGLLVRRFGGPPAFPYQPGGLWEEVAWTNAAIKYPEVNGDGLYRRSVYSFWKKTLPPPFMSMFDAPDRETSAALRELSITPQQSLALLNGPQFVEAARHLAARVSQLANGEPGPALVLAFRSVTSRPPSEEELARLLSSYDKHLTVFTANPSAVTALQSTGNSPPSALDPQAAALTQTVRVLFALSETLTQE